MSDLNISDAVMEIQNCNFLIEQNPKDFDAYALRGAAYYHLELYEEAIKDLDKAISINGECVLAYVVKGDLYRDLDKYKDALHNYSIATQINESKDVFDFNIYYNKGNINKYLGHNQDAIDDFTKVINLKSNHIEALYYRGLILTKIKKYEIAIKDFEEIIKIDNNHANAYYNLGIIYKKLGNEELTKDNYLKYNSLKNKNTNH